MRERESERERERECRGSQDARSTDETKNGKPRHPEESTSGEGEERRAKAKENKKNGRERKKTKETQSDEKKKYTPLERRDGVLRLEKLSFHIFHPLI